VALWGLAVVSALAVLAGVGWLIWKVPPALYAYVPDPKDRASAESATRTGLIAGLAGLAALGSLAVTARTYRITQQGHITDRYTKAVAQLGDEMLDVRLGGIYALERLAVDSPRDHPTVVEVLSAYVRERTASRAQPRVRPPERRTTRPPQSGRRLGPRVQPVGRGTAYPLRLTAKREPLSVDVQAALTVLGRLPARPGVDRADLSSANLAGANLSHVNLAGANLSHANLAGASLPQAHLTGALLYGTDLTRAFLDNADLTKARLDGAKLTEATLHAADLAKAILINADLTGASLDAADLTEANLAVANLTEANLAVANLTEARLDHANMAGAALYGANLTGATLLSPRFADISDTSAGVAIRKQLRRARWSDETIWPVGLGDMIRATSHGDGFGFLVDDNPPST
jgi:uncharacterized protein YjbI with pentapeptide repeats